MATKKISLFYQLSDSEIFPPPPANIARKDEWIKYQQRTIAKAGETRIIRVTYEVFNPEIEQQQKFFNGPVVDYYAIQNSEIMTADVPDILRKQTRETILSDVLGYDVQLLTRTERRRKSTTDFRSTQQWHDFLETLRETVFEPSGYRFPDSEEFWILAKKHGYEQSKTIAIESLQKWMIAKTTDL